MVRRDLTADNSPRFSHPTFFSLTHGFESNTNSLQSRLLARDGRADLSSSEQGARNF
jgi:hypothetical protein